MYDLYPDSWTDAKAARQQRSGSAQPRRRDRKEHSVVPAGLTPQLPAGKDTAAER